MRFAGQISRPFGRCLCLAHAEVVIGQVGVLPDPADVGRDLEWAGVDPVSIRSAGFIAIVTVERVGYPVEAQFPPLAANREFETGIQRLFAFFETGVKGITVGIQFLKAITRIQVEFECIILDEMDATRGTPREQILAVVKIQGHEIQLALVLVIGREVRALAESQSATQRRGALGRMPERDFRNLLGVRTRHGAEQRRRCH